MYKKIALIGGGIGGLTAGYYLSKKGHRVTIFEKENFLGGLAGDFKMEGENLEKLYHHFFKTDKDLINLLKEVGLEGQIIWNKSSTGLYWKNKMYPFNEAMDLLRFKPLSLVDKFRMGMAALYLGFDKNWQKYEDKTAVEWVRRWMGKKGYEVVWKPLLQGKFHKYYKDISMAWLWARIHTRGNSKNDKGEEVLGYIDGGFEKLVERLAELIKINGGEIKLKNEIRDTKDLEKNFDLVIDTRPDKEVEYLATVNIVFSSDQNLSEYYWHNINDSKSPFLAFIQHTNLVGKEKYNNKNIYYLGVYVPQDHEFLEMDEKKLINQWFDYLKKIFSKFDKTRAKNVSVFRFKYGQHIVSRKYKVKSYKVSDKVYRMNFAQIYPQDRGVNFGVREAKKLISSL
ncbi:MAG: FAD-dependent oxidoreductase [Candidatus Shapirobacteria bacterium]|jgi:protoporphyrinogen oxidase|nr:FAD-dependent oxidoreductase [Candidatus Shapirobacteria bacterium]